MPGTIIIDDDFTGLANDASINARVPPITNSSFGFGVDPSTVLGGGSGDVKFMGGGRAAKLRVLSIDGAVQLTLNTYGGNEEFAIFTRDNQSTPYPRWGYMASFKPSFFGGTSGVFNVVKSTDFVLAFIPGFQDIPWTYSSNNINVLALESIGSNHRVIINNSVAGTFTDSTYINTAADNRVGFLSRGSLNPSTMRVNRFSLLDSVVITGSLSYTIVRVS